MATLKDSSRNDWTSNGSLENINAGSFQRIADSLERMEKPYLVMIKDLRYLEQRCDLLSADNARMARRISALQGVITKMKKKKS